MKHYFHVIVVPVVALLTAKKTIAQNDTKFFLNESFASWLIMMIYGGFSSTMHWYTVVTINIACFCFYILIIFNFYGIKGVGNDFYVHIPTTIIFSACLMRMNEINQRSSYNLLCQSKIQENKWQRVLTMLTDGVLIMQHTESDYGILLINPSLQKIFAIKMGNIKNNLNKTNNSIHSRDCKIDSTQSILPVTNSKKGLETIDSNSKNGAALPCESNSLIQKRRFNEKYVGPIFDELFRTIRFKIIFQNTQGQEERHSKEIQFMNDFICK